MVDEQKWELAIEKFTEGKAVEGTHNDELTSEMMSELAAADDSLRIREEKRVKAETLLVDGKALLESHSYEKANEVSFLHANTTLWQENFNRNRHFSMENHQLRAEHTSNPHHNWISREMS